MLESLLGLARTLEKIDAGYEDQLLVLGNRKLDELALTKM